MSGTFKKGDIVTLDPKCLWDTPAPIESFLENALHQSRDDSGTAGWLGYEFEVVKTSYQYGKQFIALREIDDYVKDNLNWCSSRFMLAPVRDNIHKLLDESNDELPVVPSPKALTFGNGIKLVKDVGDYKVRCQAQPNGRGPTVLLNIDILTNKDGVDSFWSTVVLDPVNQRVTDEIQIPWSQVNSKTYADLLRNISFKKHSEDREVMERMSKQPIWKFAEVFYQKTISLLQMGQQPQKTT